MLFSSITFIYYFLPLTILFYYITPKKYRNVALLLCSLIFYFYGENNPVLIIACVLNYTFAILIDKSDKSNKKNYLSVGIAINLLFLIYYKYCNFFIDNVNNLFNINIKYLSVILPLGISFFTFQNISYLIDVYRKEIKAQKSIIKYATYITLFPQLIAGPIVRYKDVNDELENREETADSFGTGVKRFITGLSKKVLIANTLGKMSVVFASIEGKTVLSYILEAIGYTLQIYFDFSGYSDMAIGLGLFFGFHFKENFNYPLIASSITDFWRRWHISLSSFFKDYIYIPLGGNRKGKVRHVINILIVWTLTGFWHGANWNFILWGIYFFIFLIIEKFVLNKYLKKGLFSHLYTILIVVVSFVVFNVESISEIKIFLRSMFGLENLQFANFETMYHLKNYLVIIIIAIICSTPLIKKVSEKVSEIYNIKWLVSVVEVLIYTLLIIICTASLVSNSYNPFIYFRF